ncbi:MAG: hypothetical protein AAF483_20920 [Planctomycetota bacterium]
MSYLRASNEGDIVTLRHVAGFPVPDADHVVVMAEQPLHFEVASDGALTPLCKNGPKIDDGTQVAAVIYHEQPDSVFWTERSWRRYWWCIVFTVLYLAVVLPLLWAVLTGSLVPKSVEQRPYAFVAIILALLPTAFWWRLRLRFDKWLAVQGFSTAQAKFELESFKTNRELDLALWGILVAAFVAVLLKVSGTG